MHAPNCDPQDSDLSSRNQFPEPASEKGTVYQESPICKSIGPLFRRTCEQHRLSGPLAGVQGLPTAGPHVGEPHFVLAVRWSAINLGLYFKHAIIQAHTFF